MRLCERLIYGYRNACILAQVRFKKSRFKKSFEDMHIVKKELIYPPYVL